VTHREHLAEADSKSIPQQLPFPGGPTVPPVNGKGELNMANHHIDPNNNS
jgi:hypothetical protein